MIELRQSTAGQEIPLGYFVDSTDGDTEKTDLTIANTDIKIWKWGATALANKNSGGATHITNGVYYTALDATDTDTLGSLIVFVHVSGALTVRVECAVLPANVWDSRYGTDKLQVDAVEISGDSGAADNLEADYDETGYNKSNSIIGTAAALTANNDKTGYSLSTAGIKAIWDQLTSALSAAGSIGKLLVDNIDAAVSSRSSHSATDVWNAVTRTLTTGTRDSEIDALITAVTAINAKTTNLPADPASETNVSANGTKLAALATDLTRLLGLCHENFYLDQITYISGKMATLRKRLYSDTASVGTDNNIIATYNVTVTFASGLVDTYKEVKV